MDHTESETPIPVDQHEDPLCLGSEEASCQEQDSSF
jgi:hypothetical protein